jgi:hypothetical protein
MRASRAQNLGLTSIASSLAPGAIAASIARVVPPVPAPSSTTVCADATPASSTMRRSRKRELGVIEPICLGKRTNSRRKRTRSSIARRARLLSGMSGTFRG